MLSIVIITVIVVNLWLELVGDPEQFYLILRYVFKNKTSQSYFVLNGNPTKSC